MGGGRGGGLPGAGLFALLLLAGLLIYSPALRGDWVYDDNPAIVANGSLDDIGARAAEALFGRRTLTDFTFSLNRSAGGLDPTGYHLVNVVLHAANSFLAGLLALALLLRLGRPAGEARRASLITAFLFLSHPLMTQSVAYTAQRYTSLAAFFYLLATVLYLRARDRSSSGAWIGAFAAGYLAMRCKEISFTLPVVLLLLEIALYRGKDRRLVAVLPFLLLLALIPLSLMTGSEGTGRNLPAERLQAFREAPDMGRTEYLATQFGVVTGYLRLLFFPTGLTVDHPVRPVPGLAHLRAVIPLALWVLLGVGAWILRRRAPVLLFAYAWFLVTIAVESSIVPIRDLMVEQRVYLPSTGIFIAAAALLARAGKRGIVTAVILVLLLGGATWRRSRVWAGPIPLWTDAARKAPGLARPRVNLGLAFRSAGRFDEALQAYREADQREAGLVEVSYGRAVALEGLGRTGDAIEAYRAARLVAPDFGPAYDGAALLLDRSGRSAEASALLEEGLTRAGEDPNRLVILGGVLYRRGERAEAESAYGRAIRLDRASEGAVTGLARILVESGRAADAEPIIAEALRHRSSAHLWNSAGLVRLALGRREEAADAFRRALAIDRSMEEARNNLRSLEGSPPRR